MPNRNQEADYRYGYQGEYAEKEELGGTHSFELRLWDARIGRWLSPDPAEQFNSPYTTGNRPHMNVDPDGGWEDWVEKEDGSLVWDDRVTNQATAEKYYEGSTWRGKSNVNHYNSSQGNPMMDVFEPGGIKSTYFIQPEGNMKVGSQNLNVTPELKNVLIELWGAAYSQDDDEWLLNKLSSYNTTKYEDDESYSGWVENHLVTTKNGNTEYISGMNAVWGFRQENAGTSIRNLYSEAAGYRALVNFGEGLQVTGSGIETGSAIFLGPSGGSSILGVIFGRALQVGGFGIKSYGNYKLNRKEQIFIDALKTAAGKMGGWIWKKATK